MPAARSIRNLLRLAAVAAGVGLFAGSGAQAHSISVFAYVEDGAIHGEVFARGGTPIAGATITALDPDGAKLGETTADAEGRFTLTPTRRCPWRLVADAGEGHRAEYTVPSDELPASLPGGGEQPPEPAVPEAPQPAATPAAADGARKGPAFDALGGLDKQVIALRRDIEQLRQELRFQDIVGGIGYILGLMGVSFYFLGVRRRERSLPKADA